MSKICKKGYMEMTKKIFLETLKSVLGRSIYHYWNTSYQISKLCFCSFQQLEWNTKPQNQKKRNKEKKISKYQQWFHCLSVCITIPYKFIWILALLLLQYGNFSYKCCISCRDAYWMGVVLLGVSLTSMRVIKGATKVLHLLEEIR